MRNPFFLVLGLVIVIGSFFLFLGKTAVQENQTKIIKINDVTIEVKIVSTIETRQKGLSGREMLPEGTGMFFVFDSPAQHGFWMKDMKFPIDIIWIDENFYIVGIEREVAPETFPQIFYPNQAVKYVLELPAGFSNKYRIEIGAVIQ